MRTRCHIDLIALTVGVFGTAVMSAQQSARRSPCPGGRGRGDRVAARRPVHPLAVLGSGVHQDRRLAISRKSRDAGNQFWGRIMGTPYDKMTTDWVTAQFKRLGLEHVRAQQFDLPTQWFPTSWEVVAAGTGTPVPIKSAVPLYLSVATTAPVELEPVWLGM